jgi:hypothetical protein
LNGDYTDFATLMSRFLKSQSAMTWINKVLNCAGVDDRREPRFQLLSVLHKCCDAQPMSLVGPGRVKTRSVLFVGGVSGDPGGIVRLGAANSAELVRADA